jgi:heme/copper-type cytochrome/quinol oxidase subunit 2
MHSVTVYTNDTFRYTDSQTVTFTIDRQEPFSTLTVAIGSVAVVVFAVAIASLIFYRRRRKTHP